MRFYNVLRILDAIYIFLLSIGVGCIMTAAFSAATIFTMSEPEAGGAIMGQIFLKCNAYFNILAIVIIIYELISFVFAKAFQNVNQRRLWLLLGGINVICIFLFTLYYTPYILDAQAQGLTHTDAFYAMHKQSEIVFKILLFTLAASALWRGIVSIYPRLQNQAA